MDRVLCVILCVAVILVSVYILGYCHGSEDEIVEIPPIIETTEATEATEVTEPTETSIETTEPSVAAETIPTETKPPYSEEELETLALIIYQEAGGDACSDETRIMVGTVVMNRIADDRFPDTMYEVVTAKHQYGNLYWTGLVWPSRSSNPGEAHAVERAYDIAERVLLGERNLPSDVVWQACFKQGAEVVAYQDGMYFCR